jgi:predicted PurR-regulated permease PerM
MVLILAVLALILVWQFIQAILLALALVVILKPMYNWFLERKWIKSSSKTATGLTLIIFVLVIAIPVILIVGGAISQTAYLFSGLTVEGVEFSFRSIDTWMEGALQALLTQNFQIEKAIDKKQPRRISQGKSFLYQQACSFLPTIV